MTIIIMIMMMIVMMTIMIMMIKMMVMMMTMMRMIIEIPIMQRMVIIKFVLLLLTWFIKDILRYDKEAQTYEQEAAHSDASDDA